MKSTFQNVVTAVLVVCAVAMTYVVVSRYVEERRDPQGAIRKHIPQWEALLDGREPVYGAPNAPVKIIEFSDYECPFCAQAEKMLQRVSAANVAKVSVFRYDFPLSFHEHSFDAALAANCAAKRGAAQRYQELLFANGENLANLKWDNVAKQSGIEDLDAFHACLQDRLVAAQIKKDQSIGEKLGVQGTPTFVINGEMVAGVSNESLEGMIDSALAGKHEESLWGRLTNWR